VRIVRKRYSQYLVVRRWGFPSYLVELFGPLASHPDDVRADVSRLYGRESCTVEAILWEKASAHDQARARQNTEKG
jgi:hypothetical protein